MSLFHKSSATTRRQAMIALSVTITALSSASAATGPVQVPVSASPRAQTVRVRQDSAARARRETLASRLDSLRTEFTRRNLTDAEVEVLAKEMTTTIRALEVLIDASMRGNFSGVDVQEFPRSGMRRAPEPARVTVMVQSGPRRGYLGITFDGPLLMDNERDSVRFFAYPMVAAVDPSSPADRAGVLRGDTLIALNGIDVIDHLFSFNKLLVRDEKVTLKVRRQGDAKEFRIVVGEQPEYVVRRMPYLPGAFAPTPGVDLGQVRVRTPPPSARAGAAPLPPDAPEPGFAYAVPSRMFVVNSVVGGARLESVNEGLARNLGVKGGLQVMSVGPGTPAEQWGLREGDILLTADGETMSTVREFQRVVVDRNRASDGVKIVVLRDKKQQELMVK